VGENTFNYVIETDRPLLAANYAQLLKTNTRGHTEYTVLRPDGNTVPVELSSVVIWDAQGSPIATMAIIRNISDRKRAQEALQQSEEKYRGLIEISPDAVVVTDPGLGYTFPTVEFGLPDGIGGVQATGHATIDANGAINGLFVDTPGSGYSAAPTVTIHNGTIDTPDPFLPGGFPAVATSTVMAVTTPE
jgi:PAS domain-containing protein